jgi:hypothetical protein
LVESDNTAVRDINYEEVQPPPPPLCLLSRSYLHRANLLGDGNAFTSSFFCALCLLLLLLLLLLREQDIQLAVTFIALAEVLVYCLVGIFFFSTDMETKSFS